MSVKKPVVLRPSIEPSVDTSRTRPSPKAKLRIRKQPKPELPLRPEADQSPESDSRLKRQVPQPVESRADHGEPFIRMLSPVNVVRPITPEYIPDRLCSGFYFIVDEPAVPRLYGDPEQPDATKMQGYVIRAEIAPIPGSIVEALEMWIRRMERDEIQFDYRADLLWGYIKKTKARLAAEKA